MNLTTEANGFVSEKDGALKNNTPFMSYITKTNNKKTTKTFLIQSARCIICFNMQ